MPRRHLTNDERAIRRSRGIAVWRFLPFMLMIIAIFIMSSDDQLFGQCIGRHPATASGRGAGWARLIVAIPCSPYYVRDFSDHWLVIAIFCAGVALAIPQFFWMKRHKAYWDKVREKERIKRASDN